MAGVNGNIAVPGGQIGSGEAQVFNPMPTLNVLAGFQNAEDNRAKLEAIERMKAEALKAKTEKPIEYPQFDMTGNGGFFRSKLAEDRAKMHLEGFEAFKKAGDDPYQKAVIISQINNKSKGMASVLDAQEARAIKTAEELQKQGYSFDLDREATELSKSDDNYLNPDFNVKLIEKVKTNPRNFNYAMLGDLAATKAKTKKIKRIGVDGTEHDEEIPMFANLNKKNNQLEVKATDALKYLQQIPAVKEQLPFVFRQVMAEDKMDPAILNKPEDQLTAEDKVNILKAQSKVVDRYMGGRLGYTVVDDFNTDESRARNQAIGQRLGDVQIGQPGTNSIAIRALDKRPTEAYIPNSTPLNSPKTPVGLPAGIVVYPIGYYGDKDGVTAGNMVGTNAKILKQNVSARNFVEADGVPIATQRVELFKDGKSIGFTEKGEVIGQAINDPGILRSIPGLYEKRNGYFAAPDFLQLVEDEDGNVKRSGPGSTSLLGTVFIPDESAGSIRTHFGRKARTQKSPTRIGTNKYRQ